MSEKFTLNGQDIKSIFIGFLIAEAGAVLATATLWLNAGELDWNKLWLMELGAISSTFANFVRKFFSGSK